MNLIESLIRTETEEKDENRLAERRADFRRLEDEFPRVRRNRRHKLNIGGRTSAEKQKQKIVRLKETRLLIVEIEFPMVRGEW